METRKIAVACFAGGALTMAVALALTPEYWWFGLMAGLAGGYISYEFREVYQAIPVALRTATSWLMPQQFWTAVGWMALVFLSFFAWTAGLVAIVTVFHPGLHPNLWSEFGYAEAGIFSGLVVFIPMLLVGGGNDSCAYHISMCRNFNYCVSPPMVLFWHLPRGIWWVAPRLPGAAASAMCGVALFSRLLGRLAWHLFKLIHSQKRVLCAIDGTLGGATSYIWLAPASATSAEQAMLVVCGGLLGSAFGVANWEIVSKRLLHLPTADAVRA